MTAFDLRRTYVQLHAEGAATPVEVDADFWAKIDERTELHAGRLVTLLAMTEGASHWERHPAGDELLVQLSGAMDVIIEDEQGTVRRVPLQAGQACLVPAGLWHRQEVREPGEMLFVTPGAGTEHRPVA